MRPIIHFSAGAFTSFTAYHLFSLMIIRDQNYVYETIEEMDSILKNGMKYEAKRKQTLLFYPTSKKWSGTDIWNDFIRFIAKNKI